VSELLKCPKCGGPLEKGYIHAPRGIYWDTEKHDWNVLFSEELLSQFALTMPKAQGFRCPKCKLVLFSY
jgi:hypothetical protein